VQIAKRVNGFSLLENRDPDWERWTVQVTDDSEKRVITVLMASCMLMDMPPAILLTKGARGLQEIVSLRLAS
jgi:hypothetical protein